MGQYVLSLPGMRLWGAWMTNREKYCCPCLLGGGDGRLLLASLGGLVGELRVGGRLGGSVMGCLPDGQASNGSGYRADQRVGLSLDEGLLGGWSGAFGWLVVAEPVAGGQLRALAEELGVRQRLAEGAADRFPERAVQARRLKERQAELQRGGSGGFWRISVVAGGADEASAARVAGLFCAAADLGGLPYALSPAPIPRRARRGRLRRLSRAATGYRPRRFTDRPRCSRRLSGRRRRRFPGCASRCGPTSM